MRILVSGSSGLIGSRLVGRLQAAGHEIVRLVRHPTQARDEVTWDPASGRFDHQRAAGCDAVVHLAGENIAGGRWTDERKRRIHRSRADGTRLMVDGLAKLDASPPVFVAASAVGYYGARGDEVLTEDSPPGDDWLSEVCTDWERASEAVESWGGRRVLMRTGLVLDQEGGALGKMLPFFRLGVGGVLGSGEQWMSWISLDDQLALYERALTDERMRGAYNATAPEPVTNRTFTKALGEVLHRPTILPVPAFGLRLLYGEMADALLLTGQRALPKRLSELGHSFRHTSIGEGLHAALGDGSID